MVLLAAVIMPIVGGGSVLARSPESAAVSAPGPHLGGEIVISALDNRQHMPSVAYTIGSTMSIWWYGTTDGAGAQISTLSA